MTLLAIDIGTGGPKASIYALSGEALCSAECEYSADRKSPEGELDSADLWESLATVLIQLPSEHRLNVEAVSISSHGESFVTLDASGTPLGPFILNLDPRAAPEAKELAELFGAGELHQLTGLPCHAMYTLPKIMWLRRNRPEIFARTAQFLCVEDYLLQRIGVGAFISESLASRTFAFDLKRGAWSDMLLESVGISREMLAKPVSSGTDLGHASCEAAAELGLPIKARWVAGGHDQACCSLGGGGLREAVAVDGTGTFECISISHRERMLSQAEVLTNFPEERHVVPGMFLTLAYVPGGLVPKWLREITAESGTATRQSYSSLFSQLPREPTGLLFFPHLVGTGTPWLDAEARGTIIGLSSETTQGDLFKGGLEGITFEMLWNLELLGQAGVRIEHVNAVGGGARSAAWLQLKADIFGREILVIEGEASRMGAAICAGVGVGAFSTWQEGADALVREQRVLHPDVGRQKRYREIFESYKHFAERVYGYRVAKRQKEVQV